MLENNLIAKEIIGALTWLALLNTMEILVKILLFGLKIPPTIYRVKVKKKQKNIIKITKKCCKNKHEINTENGLMKKKIKNKTWKISI